MHTDGGVYMGGLQFFMQAAASLSLSEVANAIKGAPFFFFS